MIGAAPVPLRLMLKAALRQKVTHLRWFLRDAILDPTFVRRHVLDLDPAAERAYWRWRAMRDRWVASGCPAPPPWSMLDRRT